MKQTRTAWWLWWSALVLAACASQKPVQPAPAPKAPSLGDQLVSGSGLGLRRGDPEDALGTDLAGFLGDAFKGHVACGAKDASRVAYPSDGSREFQLVAVLLVFEDADHARCGYDVGRQPEHEVLETSKPVIADVRPVPSPSGDTLVITVLKGRTLVRIFAPNDPVAIRAARGLALAQHAFVTDDAGESPLWKRVPSGYLVGNSTRVVAASPLVDVDGVLWGTARFSCSEDEEVQAYVAQMKDADATDDARRAFQTRAIHEKLTVTPFKLGETEVVGALDPTTALETLVMRNGTVLTVVADVPSRRNCAPVIQAFSEIVTQ